MNAKCTWPELVYRVVEYYAWEPQHRRDRTVKEFQVAIRRHEVPLTLLFHLLLRWCPPDAVRTLLKQFGLSDDVQLGELWLTFPPDRHYTQPDLCLESETTRIFIEMKVESSTDLVQVQKYLLLHADEDSRADGVEKTPYLLFLTKHEFSKHWPHGEANGDVHKFLHTKTSDAPIGTLARCVGKEVLARCWARYEAVTREIRYGAATWKSIGTCLASLCGQYEQTDGHDNTDIRIMSDFIAELKQRGLMPKRG